MPSQFVMYTVSVVVRLRLPSSREERLAYIRQYGVLFQLSPLGQLAPYSIKSAEGPKLGDTVEKLRYRR